MTPTAGTANNRASLAVHLLDLAQQFTRHQDGFGRVSLHSASPDRLGPHLYQQLAQATELAKHAHRMREVVEAHQAAGLVYDVDAASRVNQLAFLAMNAGDVLVAALDQLESAHAGDRAEEEALLREVAVPVLRAQELTRHAARDAVDAAADFARSASTRRGSTADTPDGQDAREVRLSSTQHAALVAIARGQVTVSRNADEVLGKMPRLSISTLRTLHSRDLTEYHHNGRPSGRAQRVALSPKGRIALAAAFGAPAGTSASNRVVKTPAPRLTASLPSLPGTPARPPPTPHRCTDHTPSSSRKSPSPPPPLPPPGRPSALFPSEQESSPAPSSPCPPKAFSRRSITRSSPTPGGNPRLSTITSTASNAR
ncbi:hypothetical protein SLA_7127 [Streptomyces laurentii]|uniref:Uncharacterized protein n=1 Tax=Streptomyces laurentii TaxID=39478 RepID=A0A160PA78_STRLU|nr:hypothetical protein SLA_7127 [Streptomyces laurentii]